LQTQRGEDKMAFERTIHIRFTSSYLAPPKTVATPFPVLSNCMMKASELDDATERIIQYLNDRDIAINGG
jgi:hypothetical protein